MISLWRVSIPCVVCVITQLFSDSCVQFFFSTEVVEVAVGVVTGLAGDVVEVVVRIGLRSEGAALEAVTDHVNEKAALEVVTEGVNIVAAVEAIALLGVQIVEVLLERDQDMRDVMKVAVQALKEKKELMWRLRKLVQLNNI